MFVSEKLGKSGALENVDLKSISSYLQEGKPLILHVPGPTNDGHWVLGIKASSGSNMFTAVDPWTGKEKDFNYSSIKEAKNFSVKSN
jgi:hypothetical protein